MARPKKVNRIKVFEPDKLQGVDKLRHELRVINKALKYAKEINPEYVPESPLNLFTDTVEYLKSKRINSNQTVKEFASANGYSDSLFRLANLVGNTINFEDKDFSFIYRYQNAVIYTGTSFVVDEEVMEQLWYRDHVQYIEGNRAIELYQKAQKIIDAINEVKEIQPHSFKTSFNHIVKGHSYILTEINGELSVNWMYILDLQNNNQL